VLVIRRTALKWLCATFAAASAAVVAVPVLQLIAAPLRRRKSDQRRVRRVARLGDLPVGKPKEIALVGSQRDGWAVYPNETIGKIWVVRRDAATDQPAAAKVDVYTAECPHLGCTIGLGPTGTEFLCPCHKAAFDLQGQALPRDALGYENPAPRNMDTLVCRIVQDQASQSWWVEVEFEKFEYGIAAKIPRMSG
jgi:menaquinol-cytochrome c reductase iron-sulfur subunit